MNDQLVDKIPSLDLADFTSGDAKRKEKFVQDLGEAFETIGFVAIRNHGLSDELTQQLYDAVKKFFSLPDDIKEKYENPALAGQRGYIGKGKEHAKGRNTGDLKEFYHVGQELPKAELEAENYPENIWPAEVPEYKETALKAYRALENSAKSMLQAIALYLNLDEHYFDDKIRHGNSILRQIHYFPIEDPDSVPADAVRAAEHGDINLITLLMGASADGLQVLRRDGKWIPITALPEQIVVNVGDMLSRHTNNKLKSNCHGLNKPHKIQGNIVADEV